MKNSRFEKGPGSFLSCEEWQEMRKSQDFILIGKKSDEGEIFDCVVIAGETRQSLKII
jgi:hypothetical protein